MINFKNERLGELIEIFEEERNDAEKQKKELENEILLSKKKCEEFSKEMNQLRNSEHLNIKKMQTEVQKSNATFEIQIKESMKSIELLSTQKKNLEMTNEVLINKMQNMESINKKLGEKNEDLRKQLFYLSETKQEDCEENFNHINQQKLRKRKIKTDNIKGIKNNVSVQMIPSAGFLKVLSEKKESHKLTNELSFFLDQEKEEFNKDLFIPKFEHEEKLKLEVLKLNKEHIKEKTRITSDQNNKIKVLKAQIIDENKKNQEIQRLLQEKDTELHDLREVNKKIKGKIDKKKICEDLKRQSQKTSKEFEFTLKKSTQELSTEANQLKSQIIKMHNTMENQRFAFIQKLGNIFPIISKLKQEIQATKNQLPESINDTRIEVFNFLDIWTQAKRLECSEEIEKSELFFKSQFDLMMANEKKSTKKKELEVQKDLEKIMSRVEQMQQEKEANKEREQELVKEIESLKVQFEEKESELETSKILIEKKDEEIKNILLKVKMLEEVEKELHKEVTSLKETLKQKEEINQNLIADIEDLGNKISEIKELESRIIDQEIEAEKSKEEMRIEFNSKYETFEKEIRQLGDRVFEKDQMIGEYQDQIRQKEEEVSIIHAEFEKYYLQMEKKDKQIQILESRIKKASCQFEELENRNKKIQLEIQKTREKSEQKDNIIGQYKLHKEELLENLKRMENKIKKTKERETQRELEYEKLNNYKLVIERKY